MSTASVVIVTGAAGNAGSAAARLLAARGTTVVAVDRAVEPLQTLVGSLAGSSHVVEAGVDLTNAGACAALAERVLAKTGRIDGLVHTVGTFRAAPLAEADDGLWDLMMTVNLKTTLNMARAVVPAMRTAGRGAIVSIAAGAALKAPAGLSAYAASKSAVIRLTESLADELKGEGITVNTVMPSTIDTPQNRAAMPDADTSKWVTPDQVAEVMAFLVSPAASGVTGAAVPITGRG
jgi:NAD(P)-dependent dehydrogenase (short-subunit alcohol dehydrogenase family)